MVRSENAHRRDGPEENQTPGAEVPLVPACDHASAFPDLDRGGRYMEILRDIGVDVRGKVIADLGTGFGAIALACAREGAKRVVALDAEASRLAHVARRSKETGLPIEIVQGNLLSPPFGQPFADVAFLIGVVEYAGLWDDRMPVRTLQRRVFQAAHQVLKPGGTLIFASKNRTWPYFLLKDSNTRQPLVNFLPRGMADAFSQLVYGKPYREWVYSDVGWERLLAEAGFAAAKTYLPFFTYYYPFVLDEAPSLRSLATVTRNARLVRDPREEQLVLGRAWRFKAALMALGGSVGIPVAHSVMVAARKAL